MKNNLLITLFLMTSFAFAMTEQEKLAWKRNRVESYQDYNLKKYRKYTEWQSTRDAEYDDWLRSRKNVLAVIENLNKRTLPYRLKRALPMIQMKIQNYRYETNRWDAKEMALNRIDEIEMIYPYANTSGRKHLEHYKDLLETIAYKKIPEDQFIIFDSDKLK